MDSSNTNSARAVTVCFSLQSMGFITWLVLLILKLAQVIDITWFWVWFPFWIVPAFETTVFIVCLILFLILDKLGKIDY